MRRVIHCVGGVLSPLLANIALSALDEHFMRQWNGWSAWRRAERRRTGQGTWRLIRYADDFVLVVSGGREHAEALRGQAAAVLAPLGLRLSEEKTRVAHISEGFDFLGFTIRQMRKRGTSKRYVYTIPSRKSIQAAKARTKALTHRSTRYKDLDELLGSINRALQGWAGYFRHGVSCAAFAAVDYHAWFCIARWLRRKYKQGRSRLGMPELRRRFCDQNWRFAWNGIRFKGAASVPVTRYRYRGYKIPTPWTPAAATSG